MKPDYLRDITDVATPENIFIALLVTILVVVIFSPVTYALFGKLFRRMKKTFQKEIVSRIT